MKESPVVCLLPGIDRYLLTLDILFSSNHNNHKSSRGLWASDPSIDRLYQNLSIKGSEAPKRKATQTLMNVVI